MPEVGTRHADRSIASLVSCEDHVRTGGTGSQGVSETWAWRMLAPDNLAELLNYPEGKNLEE